MTVGVLSEPEAYLQTAVSTTSSNVPGSAKIRSIYYFIRAKGAGGGVGGETMQPIILRVPCSQKRRLAIIPKVIRESAAIKPLCKNDENSAVETLIVEGCGTHSNSKWVSCSSFICKISSGDSTELHTRTLAGVMLIKAKTRPKIVK